MKLKRNLTLRRIGRNYMVVELSDQGANLTNVYTMNETAAWLWKMCADMDDFTHDVLIKCLCEEYDVSEEMACEDVHRLVTEWKNLGLLEQ